MTNKLKFQLLPDPHTGSIAVNIARIGNDIVFAEPVKFTSIKDMPTQPAGPTFVVTRDEAQLLLDELVRVGIRPTETTRSDGQLAAIERHLEDMRKLVFDS